MDINVENLVSPRALEAIRQVGLHKVAGTMAGVDELTLKEAVSIIGRRAYQRRKEAAQVAAGIAAFAELRGEKVAHWGDLLRRSFAPAVAGAGIAMVPDLMAEGPFDSDKAMQHALVGGALGGLGGMGHSLHLAKQQNPHDWAGLMQTVRDLPRAF